MRALFAPVVLVGACAFITLLGSCAQTQLLEGPSPLAAEGGVGSDAEAVDAGPREPELLAQGIMGALDIAVDANYVYLAAMNSQGAFAVPKVGGKAILLAHHTSAVLGIAVDAERVYWGVAGTTNDSSAPGLIVSTPVTALGGKPDTFKTSTQFSSFSPWSLAVDDTSIYCGSSNGIFSADKNSKAETKLGSGQVPTPVVVNRDSVFWVARLDGTIFGVAKAGGSARTMVSGPSQGITGLAADDSRIYWLQNDGQRGRVYSMPTSGGDKTELATIGQTGYGMAIDAKYIYWTTLAGGSLNRVAKAGGAAELLAVNIVTPSLAGGAVATDAQYAYWTSGEGNLFRIRKD